MDIRLIRTYIAFKSDKLLKKVILDWEKYINNLTHKLCSKYCLISYQEDAISFANIELIRIIDKINTDYNNEQILAYIKTFIYKQVNIFIKNEKKNRDFSESYNDNKSYKDNHQYMYRKDVILDWLGKLKIKSKRKAMFIDYLYNDYRNAKRHQELLIRYSYNTKKALWQDIWRIRRMLKKEIQFLTKNNNF